MDNWFVSANLQGLETRGTLLRLDRYVVVFEVYQPLFPARVSEVLNEFRILVEGEPVYTGRAVISNLLFTGAAVAVEARLEEPGVLSRIPRSNGTSTYRAAHDAFFTEWEKEARLPAELKIAVLDLYTYLSDLKLLCEEAQVSAIADPLSSRAETELRIASELAPAALPCIDALHERFEEACKGLPRDLEGAAQALVRRQLHPYFLCAPFGHRTYQKPLGYAGDYEIMNMIHRNTFEGGSLFARVVHFWLVSQWAAKSVRNRIAHMKGRILEAGLRAELSRRKARILNIGCGPAREVRDLMSDSPAADWTDFHLVDFDQETLEFVSRSLSEAKALNRRATDFHTTRMSVHQLLKYSTQPLRSPLGSGYDLIYCGGLFDYFSDRVCRQLVSMYYEWLAPGGQVIVANMHDEQKPFRRMVEFLLDWRLLYRDGPCMASFVPPAAPPDAWSVVHEAALANLFLEIRKPPEG